MRKKNPDTEDIFIVENNIFENNIEGEDQKNFLNFDS